MVYQGLGYVHTKLPKVTDEYWKKPVEQLFQQYKYFEEASSDLRQNIWKECARAYMCRRTLPENEGMDWVDQSDLGETDIWDGINFLSDSLALSLMPRDQSYLELLSTNEEDQGLLNSIRDLLVSLHRKADTRGNYSKHIKQMLIYGTSAIMWRWSKEYVLKGYDLAETLRRLQEQGALNEFEQYEKTYKEYRFPDVIFNGPVVRPIDMYDLFLDPSADLSGTRDIPTIVRFYMTVEDLKYAKDNNNVQMYENLDGIEPLTLEQIYGGDDDRLELIQELGINPIAHSAGAAKYVPVYMYHQAGPRRFDGDSAEYVDTYFYVAQTNSKEEFRLIRAETNPNQSGARSIYIDTYVDWVTGAYGIGAVEKSLSAYEHKNVISALGLNAQLASVFPAVGVLAGILQDDRELKLAPGSINTLNYRKDIGTNFIAPLPTGAQGVQMGEQLEQWYGQKILGQLGAYGAILQDPTKSVKSAKTATQINTESTSGSVIRDNLIEKITIRSLEPLHQDIYDGARQWLDEAQTTFETLQDGNTQLKTVNRADLDQDRRVVVTGYHGMVNKAKEIEELQNALQILTTGNALEQLPNLKPVLQDLIFKLLGRLGVKNLDQYKVDAMQLLLQDPNIQAQLQQAAQGMAQQMLQGQPPPPAEEAQEPQDNPQEEQIEQGPNA